MKYRLLILFTTFIIFGCKEWDPYSNKKYEIIDTESRPKFNLNSFSKVEIINEFVEFPTELLVINDFLFIAESRSETNILHKYEIIEEKISSCFNKGSLDNQYLYVWQMTKDHTGSLCFTDFIKKVFVCYDLEQFCSNNEKVPKVSVKFENEPINNIVSFRDQLYFTNTENVKSRIFASDAELKSNVGYGNLLIKENLKMSDDFQLGFNDVKVQTFNNNIVMGYKYAPMIELFNIETNEIKTIIIPKKFNPTIDISYKDSNQVFAYKENFTVETIADIASTEEYLYILYDGSKWQPNSYKEGCKVIYVFDKFGEYKHQYQIDKGVIDISVYKDSLLFGVNFGGINPIVLSYKL